MKAYYLCDIIGSGTDDDPFRACVADHGVNHVAVIPTDPVTGRPTSTFGLVLVAAPSHAAVRADPRMDALPVLLPTALISAADRTAIRAALARRGLDVQMDAGGSTFGQMLRTVGRSLDPNFHESRFDVSE